MAQRSPFVVALAMTSLLSWSATARAGDLVVGNLDQPVADSIQILPYFSSLGGAFPGEKAAQQFETGPSQTTSLDHIFVSLGNLDLGTNGSFAITAELVADNSNLPTGSVLTTFTYNAATIPTSGFSVVTFDPTSAVTLQAATKYWFVIGGAYSNSADADLGSVSLQYTFSTTSHGPGGFGFYNDSNDGGSTWNLDPSNGQGVNEPFLMQVNSASVPEPGSWVLGGIGLSCTLLFARVFGSRRVNCAAMTGGPMTKSGLPRRAGILPTTGAEFS
jgi:hypothetical protein